MKFLTHNTPAHAQLYVHTTLLLRVRKLTAAGRLLAAALHLRHPHTLTYFLAAYSLATLSQCLYDCIVWVMQCPG